MNGVKKMILVKSYIHSFWHHGRKCSTDSQNRIWRSNNNYDSISVLFSQYSGKTIIHLEFQFENFILQPVSLIGQHSSSNSLQMVKFHSEYSNVMVSPKWKKEPIQEAAGFLSGLIVFQIWIRNEKKHLRILLSKSHKRASNRTNFYTQPCDWTPSTNLYETNLLF